MVDAAYVFTHGTNLNFATDINQPPVSQLGCTGYNCGNPNPIFTAIQGQLYDGWSNYNALQLRVVKRLSYGLNFQVNYAFSKSLDTGTGMVMDRVSISIRTPTAPPPIMVCPTSTRRTLSPVRSCMKCPSAKAASMRCTASSIRFWGAGASRAFQLAHRNSVHPGNPEFGTRRCRPGPRFGGHHTASAAGRQP